MEIIQSLFRDTTMSVRIFVCSVVSATALGTPIALWKTVEMLSVLLQTMKNYMDTLKYPYSI